MVGFIMSSKQKEHFVWSSLYGLRVCIGKRAWLLRFSFARLAAFIKPHPLVRMIIPRAYVYRSIYTLCKYFGQGLSFQQAGFSSWCFRQVSIEKRSKQGIVLENPFFTTFFRFSGERKIDGFPVFSTQLSLFSPVRNTLSNTPPWGDEPSLQLSRRSEAYVIFFGLKMAGDIHPIHQLDHSKMSSLFWVNARKKCIFWTLLAARG